MPEREQCPICGKVFGPPEYTSQYSTPPSLKARLVTHMVTSHPDQVKIYIKPDPNNIETWLIKLEASEF